MPSSLQAYRIFIASPGGLDDFRNCFRSTIDKYNDADAIRRGVAFIPVGWEMTLGGIGRPQHIINNDLSECDYCVLVLRDRWGSPADTDPNSPTGTEEEFNLALKLSEDPTKFMTNVVVFFAAIEPGRMSDPGPQLKKVLDFRKATEAGKQLLFHHVEGPEDFADVLRRYLANWVRVHEQKMEEAAADTPQPVTLVPELDYTEEVDGSAEEPASEASEVDPISHSDVLISQGRYTEAESILSEAIAKGRDPRAQLAYSRLLARLHRRMQALSAMKQALEMAQAVGDHVTAGEAAEGLARLSDELGRDADVGAFAGMALASYDRAEDRVGLARTFTLLGEWNRKTNDHEEALGAYRQAIELARTEGALLIEANAFIGLSEVHRDLEQLGEAREALSRGILARQEAGAPDTGDTHAALGAVLEGLGDDAGAEQEYGVSTDLFTKAGDRAGLADAADHLGQICVRKGDLDGAEDAFRHSAAMFESVQNIEGARDAYLSLGRTQIARGSYDAASASLRSSLALAQRQHGDAARSAQSEITDLLDLALGEASAADARSAAQTSTPHQS